jgi:general secretion pathway protein G
MQRSFALRSPAVGEQARALHLKFARTPGTELEARVPVLHARESTRPIVGTWSPSAIWLGCASRSSSPSWLSDRPRERGKPGTRRTRRRHVMHTPRNRLARSFAHAHRGMTLLEIMIVLAILALVMGLLVGPKLINMFERSKVDLTKIKLNQYANEAFLHWSTAHPGKPCPDNLSDLNADMNSKDSNDSWGRPIKMLCGADLPPGAKRFAVMSVGADGKEGTDDDIKSWD